MHSAVCMCDACVRGEILVSFHERRLSTFIYKMSVIWIFSCE